MYKPSQPLVFGEFRDFCPPFKPKWDGSLQFSSIRVLRLLIHCMAAMSIEENFIKKSEYRAKESRTVEKSNRTTAERALERGRVSI